MEFSNSTSAKATATAAAVFYHKKPFGLNFINTTHISL
jgi:hypothetical protein